MRVGERDIAKRGFDFPAGVGRLNFAHAFALLHVQGEFVGRNQNGVVALRNRGGVADVVGVSVRKGDVSAGNIVRSALGDRVAG